MLVQAHLICWFTVQSEESNYEDGLAAVSWSVLRKKKLIASKTFFLD